MCISQSAEVLTVSRYSRSSSLTLFFKARSVKPMIAFIGVLISWLMFARNWPLARLANSAASRSAVSAAFSCWTDLVFRATTQRVLSIHNSTKTTAAAAMPANRNNGGSWPTNARNNCTFAWIRWFITNILRIAGPYANRLYVEALHDLIVQSTVFNEGHCPGSKNWVKGPPGK